MTGTEISYILYTAAALIVLFSFPWFLSQYLYLNDKTCRNCYGDGGESFPSFGWIECEYCNGTGVRE